MKKLSNLLHKTKEKAKQGLMVTLGSLIITGGSGCTQVYRVETHKERPNIVLCERVQDPDNDGLDYDKDYINEKKNFEKGEKITIIYHSKNSKGKKIEMMLEHHDGIYEGKLGMGWIAEKQDFPVGYRIDSNNIPSGAYNLFIYIDDVLIDFTKFTLRD